MNGSASPCPRGTYSETAGAEDLSYCLSCEPGYFCPNRGMVTVIQTPCPVGHFCEPSTISPTPCPVGTHRNVTRAAHVSDCYPCLPGFHCPLNGTVHGSPCNSAQSCPTGTINPIICPPGFYCPKPDETIPCPPGYYCPEGSVFFTECPRDHYCESPVCDPAYYEHAGADRPIICPLGYREIPNIGENSTRDSAESTCEPCPVGAYANSSDFSGSRVCLTCPPGYYCLGGSVIGDPEFSPVYNASLCPAGHYCPSESYYPTACSAGSFNPFKGESDETSCLPCPVDSYTHIPGQRGCYNCSTLATTSQVGSTECLCDGLYRVFQVRTFCCLQ